MPGEQLGEACARASRLEQVTIVLSSSTESIFRQAICASNMRKGHGSVPETPVHRKPSPPPNARRVGRRGRGRTLSVEAAKTTLSTHQEEAEHDELGGRRIAELKIWLRMFDFRQFLADSNLRLLVGDEEQEREGVGGGGGYG